MERGERAFELLPLVMRAELQRQGGAAWTQTEELRLRLGRPPVASRHGKDFTLNALPPVGEKELRYVMDKATSGSPYIWEDSIRQGYVTAPGGIRVGLCGNVRSGSGCWAPGGLTSVNIRIPTERIGCAAGVVRFPVESALILSPPGGGKTTLLRDWIRCLSDHGERVGVCDERGELAGFDGREFACDLGTHTDVMTGCEKARGAMMLLRAMNPTVLAMDEITSPEDAEACLASAHCGVKVLATAHARDRAELERRPIYRQVISSSVFERLIFIVVRNGKREYREEKVE